jgi:hypothetical protein
MTAAALACLAAVAPARTAEAHPLHTTHADVEVADGAVRVTLRVFADDYGRAVAGWRGAAAPGAAREDAYAAAAFTLAGGDGRRIALAPCGRRARGEVVLVCLRGPAPRGLAGGTVRSALMFGLYDDQVNVVRATYGGRRHALLFVPGDGFKRLP